MLAHTLDRVRSINRVDHVLVATSTDRTDDAVAEFAHAAGFSCWRGPLEDVLGRVLPLHWRTRLMQWFGSAATVRCSIPAWSPRRSSFFSVTDLTWSPTSFRAAFRKDNPSRLSPAAR